MPLFLVLQSLIQAKMQKHQGTVLRQKQTIVSYSIFSHPYTKGLLSSLPKMDQSREEKLFVIDGVVPLPVNMKPCCGFHERCGECMPGKCDRQNVEQVTVEKDHTVRCLLAKGC